MGIVENITSSRMKIYMQGILITLLLLDEHLVMEHNCSTHKVVMP